MISTVFMALWGLTSRSYKSVYRLVDEHNALPIGLAFGYAYAGSVAMLTTVLVDIRYVMITGHIVVILTFMWMQRRVLMSVLADHDSTVGIMRTIREVPVEDTSDKDPTLDSPFFETRVKFLNLCQVCVSLSVCLSESL